MNLLIYRIILNKFSTKMWIDKKKQKKINNFGSMLYFKKISLEKS